MATDDVELAWLAFSHIIIDPDDVPADEGCGVIDEPVCWTSRFACFFYRPVVEGATNGFLSCEAQPGASFLLALLPTQSASESEAALPRSSRELHGLPLLALALVGETGGTCNNHGVVSQVTVLGTNHYCEGAECTNDGVILLVGRTVSCHGNGVAVVCVDDRCQVVRPLMLHAP